MPRRKTPVVADPAASWPRWSIPWNRAPNCVSLQAGPRVPAIPHTDDHSRGELRFRLGTISTCLLGVPTGREDLDHVSDGLAAGELVELDAGPGLLEVEEEV